MDSENNEVENYPLENDLNRRSLLSGILRKLMPEFDNYNDSRTWFYTGTLSYKQYRRLLALHYGKNNEQIIAECKPLIEKMPKE